MFVRAVEVLSRRPEICVRKSEHFNSILSSEDRPSWAGNVGRRSYLAPREDEAKDGDGLVWSFQTGSNGGDEVGVQDGG